MSNELKKRPDPRDMIARAPPERKAELAAELSRPDVQRALQKGEGGLDAELAAQLAPQLGNDAVKEMMLSSTATSTLAASVKGVDGAKQEQAEEKGEERDEELDSEVDQEVESQSSLPSFSGPTGAAGASPWSMGRFFGGDGDDDAAHAGVVPGRWRPMPALAEPEDPPEVTGEAPEAADSAVDREWLVEAYRELGKPTYRKGLLTKHLRDPVKMCRPSFEPESLEESLDSGFGRARASLRLLAEHAEIPAARRLAWTLCGAGAAVAPAAMGYSGATARALHGLDAVLQLLPNREAWERLLEVRLAVNARALTEQHADLLEVGTLGAVRLLRSIVDVGALSTPGTGQGTGLLPHPAAITALELASAMQPMPELYPWVWESAADDDLLESEAMNAVDSVLLAFTGGPTASAGVTRAHLGPLFARLNSLLDALGLAQVEIAAAALASMSGGVSGEHALAAIRDADDALVRMARRLVRAGRAIEARVGTTDTEAITVLSWEAVAVREGADLARRSALGELARHIACVTVPYENDPQLTQISLQLADGNVRGASCSPALALLPGVALRTGRPEVAAALLDIETFTPTYIGTPRSIGFSLRIALALLNFASVDKLGQQLAVEAERQGSVFGAAEAAIALTVGTDSDVYEPLRRAAVWLRRRKRSDAISLLVARWGELRLAAIGADGGPQAADAVISDGWERES